MSSENVIHIKLEHSEALRTRRGILSSEMSSLRIAKMIGRYRALRLEELKLKARLYSKIKETRSNIKKLQNHLPKPKVPGILKRDREEEEPVEKKYQPKDIESQIRDIQRRLEQLQRQP